MSQLLILGIVVLAVGHLRRRKWQELTAHVPSEFAQHLPVRSGTIAPSTTAFNLCNVNVVLRLARSQSGVRLGALRIICCVLVAFGATTVATAVGTDDDFDRSNSNTLGSNWTNTVNAVGIASNRAQIQTPDVMNLARYTGRTFTSDHYSEATYKTTGGLYLVLAVRAQANGDAYLCMPYLFGNEVRIYSYVGGTETLLTSLSGAAPAGNHVYRCEATGSSPTAIKVYDNGVQIGSTYTDSTAGLQSGGAPGLGGKKSEDQWDDWSGGDIGGGGGVGGGDDDFDRSDSVTLGPNWTNTVNAVGIASNRAQIQTPDVMNLARYTGTSFTSDHYSEATYKTTGGLYLVLAVRAQANGDAYLCMPYLFGNEVRIYSFVGGTETLLTSLPGAAPAGDHVYRCEASGGSPTSIKVYDNGVQVGSTFTDSTTGLQSGGAPGLGGKKSEDQWDDWSGGNVGAGGGGTAPCSGCMTAAQLLSGYQGGFRMPIGGAPNNGLWMDNAPYAIAYNPASGRLFASQRNQLVADLIIPPLVNTSTVTSMNHATFGQGGLYDPHEHYPDATMDYCTQAQRDSGSCQAATIQGLLVYNSRLYVSYGIPYDASNIQKRSHISRPLSLTTTGNVIGPDQLCDGTGLGPEWIANRGTHPIEGGPNGCTGFTGGYMANVPASLQVALGGKAATGWCCPSVIYRTSYGPGLGGFDPADIGDGSQPQPWQAWVAYPSAHQTLGPWEAAGELFGITTQVKGAVFIDGTNTVAFFGSQGKTYCYGEGTSDASLDRQEVPGEPGVIYCYDPTSNAKGNHGYPYKYSVWLYNVQDFIAVKNGTKNAWDVVPYERADITFPYMPPDNIQQAIAGATWDPSTRRLFLSQYGVDLANGTYHGVIQVFMVPSP
jgi:hypothetical protein